ncbi:MULTISPECIES: hypothetical protein [unclassified Minwuia]|jgi:hypothetical protein|uniref:hypothetical protein n=1 Tax=unclassified Minwuia TaxID=2618799 RepID=UPI002479C54A|nr:MULTISPECIES: hypothetical protein [unclassified Minwuia]
MVSSLFRAAIRAGCVGALLFAAGPVLAQGGEVSVGTGKTSIRIVAPGTGGNNVTRLQTNRQFVSRVLKQVTIINGNNPLNQIDPVRNNNGQVFASLEDAVNANQGNNNGGGGGGLANCQGVTVQMQASGTAPPDFRFASLDIDPNTGDCTVVADGSTGSALIAQIPANGGVDFTAAEVFPDRLVGLFEFDPPGAIDVDVPLDTPTTVTIKATNGFTVQITVTVSALGGGEFSFTVNAIQQVA